MKHLWKTFAATLVLAWACSGHEEAAEDRFSVSGLSETVTFAAESPEVVSFQVVSTRSWTIRIENLDWLKVSALKGEATEGTTITLTAQDNGRTQREGKLTVTSGDQSRTFTILQEAVQITPTFTSSHDSAEAIAFEAVDNQPYSFTVQSNVAWHLEAGEGAFVEVTPASAEADRQVTVSVVAEDNFEAERTCTFSLCPEGMEPFTYRVTQKAFQPFLTVEGASEDGIVFEIGGGEATLQVRSDAAWTLEKADLDWLTASAEGGAGNRKGEAETVTLTAGFNSGALRKGTLTFTSSNTAVAPVTVTVSQSANKEPILLAAWTLGDGALLTEKHTDMQTEGKTKADLPEGTEATMELIDVTPDLGTSSAYPSADNAGNYALKGFWTGDYILFRIPVSTIPAGSTINFKVGMSHNLSPKLWAVEYLDGDDGEWKATSLKKYESTGLPEEDIWVTIDLGNTKAVTDVDESADLTAAVTGELKMRLRFVDGRFGSTSAGVEKILTKPASGAARLRPYADNSVSALEIWVKYN
ncbi:MAG: BACON domain-containing protein [Bacteroidales bacterium]|nr:BACON domain-containing protein [Bacteroidales bacterium]